MRKDLEYRSVEIVSAVGKELFARGLVDRWILEIAHDIHGIYRFVPDIKPVKGDLVVVDRLGLHLQIYPGMSSNDTMSVSARLLDWTEFDAISKSSSDASVSLGNEHGAVRGGYFVNNTASSPWGWDSSIVVDHIEAQIA